MLKIDHLLIKHFIRFLCWQQLDSVDVGEPLIDNAAEGDQHQNYIKVLIYLIWLLHLLIIVINYHHIPNCSSADIPHPCLLSSADSEDITSPKRYDPSDSHADLFNCRFVR